MKRFLILTWMVAGLACYALANPQGDTLASHRPPLTSQRYNEFFLEAICQREKGNSDAAFDL